MSHSACQIGPSVSDCFRQCYVTGDKPSGRHQTSVEALGEGTLSRRWSNSPWNSPLFPRGTCTRYQWLSGTTNSLPVEDMQVWLQETRDSLLQYQSNFECLSLELQTRMASPLESSALVVLGHKIAAQQTCNGHLSFEYSANRQSGFWPAPASVFPNSPRYLRGTCPAIDFSRPKRPEKIIKPSLLGRIEIQKETHSVALTILWLPVQ
jgi:hypothetical protein